MQTALFRNKVLWSLLIFSAFIHEVYAQTPVASFVSNPAHNGTSVTICQNEVITFTNTSSQTTTGASYTWNFGAGANPQTATGIGPHNITYNSAGSFNAVLTVNNNNNTAPSNFTINVTVNARPVSNITLLSSGGGYSTTTFNGTRVFRNCNATGNALFSFQSNHNNSVTQTFNWGDGTTSTQSDMTGNQISYTFSIGQFTVRHTVTINGCSNFTDYIVFNGSAPVIAVSGSGQTTCLPSPYSIDILSNQVPINYNVSFSDGTAAQLFTTANDTTIAHVFNSSSCGVDYVISPGIPPIENAFSATIIAQNFCSVNGFPTVFTVGPITISTGPQADFEFTPASPVCQGAPVTFKDISNGGENITSNGCDSVYSFYWEVLQASGYSITGGSTGSNNGFTGGSFDFSQWTNGSEELEITFDDPGTYTVRIYAANSCGVDTTDHPIVINPTGAVVMDLYSQTICSGDNTTVFTMTSTVPGYTIQWNISDTANVTGLTVFSGSGPSPLSYNSITLTNNTNNQGFVEISATVGCTNVPATIHTIYVDPQANITADPMESLVCSGEETDVSLSSNLNGTSFTWTSNSVNFITGHSAGSGNNIRQTLINFGTSIDTVYYNVSIGNTVCPGPNIIVKVAVQPQITINQNPDITVCPGTLIDPADYVSVPGGANITWTNNNPGIGLGLLGNGNPDAWTAPENASGNPITGTITINAQLNDCPPAQDQFNVTIVSTPVFNYVLNPSTGLNCITRTAEITGFTIPTDCTVQWTGPVIISGAGTTNITVGAAGQYVINMTDNTHGCLNSETITVNPPREIRITNLNSQNVRCFNGSDGRISITTDNDPAALNYNWTGANSSENTANNLSAGSYKVTVTNESGCLDSVSVNLSQAPEITIELMDSLVSECLEANGRLMVGADGGRGGFEYAWSNGQRGAIAQEIDAGNFTVTVTDAVGCTITESFEIACRPLVPPVIPQFLSPNNDGRNDIWIIENLDLYPNNKVTVFNRWGNIVFEAEPYNNDWNGHFKGSHPDPLPASTYFYLIDTKKKSQRPFNGYIEIQP
jgi:gliding motility-associated-like protein